jgi:Asp-tRNA(Asn)/Glu-tRNA(Gln) amidotransferase A subunit family amidase
MLPADPPSDPLLRLSAVELVRLLRTRQLGAVELLRAVLRRADEITEPVNPFAVRLDERALAAAAESDRRLAGGRARPLEGLPVTAKDSQWMAGVPTTSGSRARAGWLPPGTVGAVSRLLDAGAVVYAKTTTSEFCYFGTSSAPGFGSTANPHDLTRTAGGSSGGAAAQVAAWAGPVGLGGDGGGSIRIPAAFCGLVGHKPTFGLVPHEPSGPTWKTLIAIGPLTRTVGDAQLLTDVLVGHDPTDRHSVLAPPPSGPADLRVAVSPDLGYAALDDDVRARFEAAVDALAAAGVQIVHGHPDVRDTLVTWATIATAEARWGESAIYTGSPELLSPQVRAYLAFGETVSAEDYVAAQFARERIHAAYAAFFATTGAHALFTPTLGCVAFPGDREYPERIGDRPVDPLWRDWAPMLCDANLTGMPATTVPIGHDAAGLPVGGHFTAPRFGDRTTLRLAGLLANAMARQPVEGGAAR